MLLLPLIITINYNNDGEELAYRITLAKCKCVVYSSECSELVSAIKNYIAYSCDL